MAKFLEFFKKINNLADELNEALKNHANSDVELNPFNEAFSQTYVWVDEEDKS